MSLMIFCRSVITQFTMSKRTILKKVIFLIIITREVLKTMMLIKVVDGRIYRVKVEGVLRIPAPKALSSIRPN
jgi:hypothetical protein